MRDLKEVVKSFLEENSEYLEEWFFHDGWRPDSNYAGEAEIAANKRLVDSGISVEHVDGYGGEDCGRDYWSVYSFKDNKTGEKVYVKFDGWYASHYGSEYEGWLFVKGVVVQKIEFQSE